MSSQAPPGWYQDQDGQTRFWDGAAWTDDVGSPAVSGTEEPSSNETGALGRLKQSAVDRRSARAAGARIRSERARDAGTLVTSGIFGTSTIEIYSGGFVRVASGERATFLGKSQPGRSMSPGQPVSIKRSTPFEALRSIKFAQAAHDRTTDAALPSEGAIGPVVAKLMKGGKAAFKGSVPGLAATGIAHIASMESRTSYLTIVTDREIHQLTNQGHNGLVRTTNKGHIEVGLALEAAGNAALGTTADQSSESQGLPPRHEGQGAPASDPTDATPSMGGRLRELAELHQEGILSDQEFTSAKAKLLEGL